MPSRSMAESLSFSSAFVSTAPRLFPILRRLASTRFSFTLFGIRRPSSRRFSVM